MSHYTVMVLTTEKPTEELLGAVWLTVVDVHI